MQKIIAVAASLKNRLGQPAQSLQDMQKWLQVVCAQGTVRVLFPERNVSGTITAPLAHALAESIPGHEKQAYDLTGSQALDYYQVADRVTTEVQRLLGRPPFLMQQYIQDYQASWVR